MRQLIFRLLLCIAVLLPSYSTIVVADEQPRVIMQTNLGDITLELNKKLAPKTVVNYLRYAKEAAFDNTIFHRVIKGFMIQGGGFDADFRKKNTHTAINNEADNGLSNRRGTIAMARTGDPHSATAQFFINTVDNGFLDHTSKTNRGWGYTVFGKVIKGMDVVDRISNLKTGRGGPFPSDVPKETVTIKSIKIIPAKH